VKEDKVATFDGTVESLINWHKDYAHLYNVFAKNVLKDSGPTVEFMKQLLINDNIYEHYDYHVINGLPFLTSKSELARDMLENIESFCFESQEMFSNKITPHEFKQRISKVHFGETK